MAADSLLSGNSEVITYVDKIKVHNGWLIGCAGDTRTYTNATNVVKHFLIDDNFENPDILDTFADRHLGGDKFTIVLAHRKYGIWDYDGSFTKIDADFYAIGSGSAFAIGAMALGGSASDAVRIACQYHLHSGGAIKEVAVP